jgi:hypothetical protein
MDQRHAHPDRPYALSNIRQVAELHRCRLTVVLRRRVSHTFGYRDLRNSIIAS